MQDDPPASAVRARRREGLDQARAELLAGQLHQAQRRHFRHLVTGAVASQRLGQPPQHQVAVGLQHHVDEVDDDDAADVAQPQLPHDLLGGLEVVASDGLLEVAAGTGELAGVDVDHRHGLGAVDHQRAAGGQPHLAVHRLGELLVDAVHRKHVGRVVRIGRRLVLGHPRQQFGRDGRHVVVDGLPRVLTGDHQAGEVLVEQVADYLDQDVGLFVERHRGAGLLLGDFGSLGLDLGPALLQPLHVGADVFFLDALGGGADDHPGIGGDDLAQDLLEALTLGVGQLTADAGRRRAGHVNQVAAGQRHLGRQASALVTDGVLAHLHDHVVARLEGLLDLAVGTSQTGGLPVDLAGVEHPVAATADVDERRLHGRQHVLHDAQVDVAHQRRRRGRRDEVLDHHAVLEHRDLGVASALVRRLGPHLVADHHPAFDGFAPSQEFGLTQDRRTPTAGVASVAAALPFGFQPGGAADALDFRVAPGGLAAPALALARLTRLTLMDDRVGRVVGRRTAVVVVAGAGLASPAAPPAAVTALGRRRVVVIGVVIRVPGVV